jgi:hypothetical protein
VDAAFDEAEATLQEVEQELESYLKSVRKILGTNVTYVQLHKETHVLEVPEVCPMMSQLCIRSLGSPILAPLPTCIKYLPFANVGQLILHVRPVLGANPYAT